MTIQGRNLLLDALSPASREALLTHAETVELPSRKVLQNQEEPPRYAYFVLSGMASVVVTLPEGGSQETALIGHEGFTGGYSLLGPSTPPAVVFMQMQGVGLRIPMPVLEELFSSSAKIRTRINEHIQLLAMTTSQVAACNTAHEAEPRLARWLLMLQDRTGLDTFQLTQEFLSEMLGARRTTVAVAAGALQRSGFIEYTRGKVTILSREKLVSAACDCYPVTYRLLQGLYRRPFVRNGPQTPPLAERAGRRENGYSSEAGLLVTDQEP